MKADWALYIWEEVKALHVGMEGWLSSLLTNNSLREICVCERRRRLCTWAWRELTTCTCWAISQAVCFTHSSVCRSFRKDGGASEWAPFSHSTSSGLSYLSCNQPGIRFHARNLILQLKLWSRGWTFVKDSYSILLCYFKIWLFFMPVNGEQLSQSRKNTSNY